MSCLDLDIKIGASKVILQTNKGRHRRWHRTHRARDGTHNNFTTSALSSAIPLDRHMKAMRTQQIHIKTRFQQISNISISIIFPTEKNSRRQVKKKQICKMQMLEMSKDEYTRHTAYLITRSRGGVARLR